MRKVPPGIAIMSMPTSDVSASVNREAAAFSVGNDVPLLIDCRIVEADLAQNQPRRSQYEPATYTARTAADHLGRNRLSQTQQGKRTTSFNLKEVNARDLSRARCNLPMGAPGWSRKF